LIILEKVIYPTGKGRIIVDINKVNNDYHAKASLQDCADSHVGYGSTKQEAIFDALSLLAKHLLE
jgi:hypothetical protein